MAHIPEKNNLINLAVGLVVLLLIGALMEHFPDDAGPRNDYFLSASLAPVTNI